MSVPSPPPPPQALPLPFPPQPAALTQGMGVSDGVSAGASSKPALWLRRNLTLFPPAHDYAPRQAYLYGGGNVQGI